MAEQSYCLCVIFFGGAKEKAEQFRIPPPTEKQKDILLFSSFLRILRVQTGHYQNSFIIFIT